MDRKPEATRTALEERTARLLAGTAQFKAPDSIESRVLAGIERRVRVPWWQRRVPEWPLLAQLIFAFTGIATAAALLLARPTTPAPLSAVIAQPAAVLQRPAADLHTTLSALASLHRLADNLVGAMPGVWYGGLALGAAAYLALFFLVAFGYRLLVTPVASR
ncbi:MAG TPA: hypothetical protein VK696_05345 [Steroidobacteraceae bacterium]|jgi:hypothetical protein|nr:hypothetical protein [Steroidobacteraceae bacterium]